MHGGRGGTSRVTKLRQHYQGPKLDFCSEKRLGPLLLPWTMEVVLRLLGQRVVAGKESGVMEKKIFLIDCSWAVHYNNTKNRQSQDSCGNNSITSESLPMTPCSLRSLRTLGTSPQRSNAESYVTSGLSEPWSSNEFKSLRVRSSYENDAERMFRQTEFRTGKICAWQLLHFQHILNVKSLSFQKWH